MISTFTMEATTRERQDSNLQPHGGDPIVAGLTTTVTVRIEGG